MYTVACRERETSRTSHSSGQYVSIGSKVIVISQGVDEEQLNSYKRSGNPAFEIGGGARKAGNDFTERSAVDVRNLYNFGVANENA